MKKIIYTILQYSGFNYIYSLFLNRRVFIVMYHSVSDPGNAGRLHGHLYSHISVGRDGFEQQIAYMKKRGHTFISFRDLGKPEVESMRKPTIIYFDDGFKDVYETAVPILRKYGAPATLFLVTGVLDRTHMLWTILYKDALARRGASEAEQAQKIDLIKSRDERFRIEAMQGFSIKDHMRLFEAFMSWDDVRELSRSGFEVGSHGVTHSRLTELTDGEMQEELARSKSRLENEAASHVICLSLPYGRGNDAVVSAAHAAGYKHVVSAGLGLNRLSATYRHPGTFLKNVSPRPGESLMMFKLRLYSLNLNK